MNSPFFLHHSAYHVDNWDKNFGFFVVLDFYLFIIVLEGRIFRENVVFNIL